MNCDEAFNALTDSEIDGRRRDELQRHLNFCPRCRQMREVLAPALECFETENEANTADAREARRDESASPVRKQFLSVEAVQTAREAAQRLSTIRSPGPSRVGHRAKWAMVQAAAVAVAVAVAFTMFAPSASSPENRPSAAAKSSPAVVAQCLWKKQPRDEKPSKGSRAIVDSCVACHFDRFPE